MTAHDELIAELLAALQAAAPPPPAPEPEPEPIVLHPRRVKARKGWLVALPTVTVQTPADESDPRPKGTKVTGSAWRGPVDCPDCGRGLVSRGTDLVCARLPLTVRVPGAGGIVRCGVRDG